MKFFFSVRVNFFFCFFSYFSFGYFDNECGTGSNEDSIVIFEFFRFRQFFTIEKEVVVDLILELNKFDLMIVGGGVGCAYFLVFFFSSLLHQRLAQA